MKKNLTVCCSLFAAELLGLYPFQIYIDYLRNKFGVWDSSTGILSFSQVAGSHVVHGYGLIAVVYIILSVALCFFGHQASKEGTKVAGKLFVFLGLLGIVCSILMYFGAGINYSGLDLA